MSTTLDDAAMKRIKEALVARAKRRLAVTEQAADLDDAAARWSRTPRSPRTTSGRPRSPAT